MATAAAAGVRPQNITRRSKPPSARSAARSGPTRKIEPAITTGAGAAQRVADGGPRVVDRDDRQCVRRRAARSPAPAPSAPLARGLAARVATTRAACGSSGASTPVTSLSRMTEVTSVTADRPVSSR